MVFSPENHDIIMSKLSILSLHLPDPEGKIVAQILDPIKTDKLDTFHCFPSLIKELQIKIWQFAFPPPRRVEVRPNRFCRQKKPHCSSCKCRAKHTAPLPTTLYVNHQSREETLRHYRLVWMKSETQGTFNGKVKPLCFDPSRDFLYTDMFDMMCCTRSDWMTPLIAHRFLNRDCFKDVKVLEVRSWEWYDRIGESLQTPYCVALEVFTQLEEIRLMLHHPSQYVAKFCADCRSRHKGRPWTKSMEKKSINAMTAFYRRIHDDTAIDEQLAELGVQMDTKNKIAEVKIPKVVIVPWTRRC